MALEATVLCLDGSEYMRNGDYIPNRMEAMKDAASLLCRIKTDVNPESTVGIVACGLPMGPKVLCSCSQDMGALLSACANLSIAGGKTDFVRSLEVSALALKHRRNKNGDQRVVVFVGSPVEEDEAALVKLAKKLKKNNICVDIVAMGEVEENEPKLKAFIEAVDKSNTSHLVVIPAGILPSEVLMTSPIITGSMGGDYGEDVGGAAGGAFAEYGGVDPRQDPELANALRASIEEARARMAAEAASAEQASAANAPVAETPKAQAENAAAAVDEDEENLRLALQMSVEESEGGSAQPVSASPAGGAAEEEEDEKELAMALALSQQEDEAHAQSSATAAQAQAPLGDPTGVLDPNYVKELMEGLGDVDINDPQIQQLLMGGANPPEEGPDSKKQKKDKEDETK